MPVGKMLASVFLGFLLAYTRPGFAVTYDVLDLPAVPSELASKSLLYTVARFGDRYFATGHRGHIIYSDDNGATWTQAQVPVRSSILDVFFPTPEQGWAVGHEGVILHSTDGGETWIKQFDGNQYGENGLEFYKKKLAEDPENETYQLLVEEMQFAVEQGADKPFFRVVFHNEDYGHAAGAYGMLLMTEDGGKTWIPRMEAIENYGFNHLFDFAPLGDMQFFICGEMGVILHGDLHKRVATALSTPWEGSFFTCLRTDDGSVIMGGLRGNVFRTEDAGKTFIRVKKPESSAIVDSIVLSDGRVLLAGQGGDMLVSSDNGKTFSRLPIRGIERIHSVAEGAEGELLIAGPNGIQTVSLKQ